MTNPNPNYSNVRVGGVQSHGIRQPLEVQTGATYECYKEVDLGTIAASPYYLTADQAGASLITVNPTVALTLVFPTCQAGACMTILNLNATNAITVEVNGNATNTAIIPVSKAGVVMHMAVLGAPIGGIYLTAPAAGY